MTALTIQSLLNIHIASIAPNTNDYSLYRIYLGGGRFEASPVAVANRNVHPEWFEKEPGIKSFLDQHLIAEYMNNKNSNVLTEFLGCVALIFGVPYDKVEALSDQFYLAVNESHADTVDLEHQFRSMHESIH